MSEQGSLTVRRISVLGLPVLLCLAAPGCGDSGSPLRDLGGDSSVDDDAASAQDSSTASQDSSTTSQDLSTASDLSSTDFDGVHCGTMTCGSGSTCCLVPNTNTKMVDAMCVSGSACSPSSISASCDGPEDCSPGTPNCCAYLMIGNQNQLSGNASCTQSCPGSATVTSGGGGTLTSRLCHSPGDCVGYSGSTPLGNQNFDACCSYPGVTYQFCAPKLITVLFSNVTCNTPG
jgi:hypothetical protein